jgi:peptide deformylase
MSILSIVEKGNPVLNKPSEPVPVGDILSDDVQKLINNMKETLSGISDGVGLAAPQVNVPLQIFIVSKRVLAKNIVQSLDDLVCINPKIVKFSKTKKWLDGEGCLSVRWYYGKVFRSTNVTLEYYDEKGQKQTRGAGGLLAHIFQHECDHLRGELFIDKAKDIEYIEIEEINVSGVKNE